MKKIKLLAFILLFVSLSSGSMAQMKQRSTNSSKATGGGFKRFITKTPWTFGLSGHVVDDDGNPFKKLFDVSKSWNFLAYPVRLTIDGYYQSGFSFQTEFAYTQYKVGKNINNETIGSQWTFFSADAHVKYDLNEVIGQTNWFDPYVSAGYGFTLRSGAYKRPTSFNFNAGLGFNIWIYENLGFNAQSMAKFAMIEGTSNYLHHSVGIIYKLEGGRGSHPGRLGKRYKFMSKGGRK
jgi:OOP family OmpA-OmpF porin